MDNNNWAGIVVKTYYYIILFSFIFGALKGLISDGKYYSRSHTALWIGNTRTPLSRLNSKRLETATPNIMVF